MSLDDLLQKVSAVKLPGGVVGKVSLVLVVTSLSIASLAVFSKNEWILGGAIAAIFLLAFPMLWRLINFADRNPQAALLEGAEFLVHQQILLGTKSNPTIDLDVEAIVEERPLELPPAEGALLNQPEDAEVAVPALPDREERR